MESRYTRESFIRRASGAVAGLALGGSFAGPAGAADAAAMTPDAALRRLLTGNRRYVRAKATHPRQTGKRRQSLTSGQQPFAIVFGCVDSRVPPEIVFDQGLGDLLVIRTAGEVIDDAVLGSIEFGIAELSIPLIVVLGHERCGAVTAALESDAKPPPHIAYLIDHLRPAVEQTKDEPGDHLDNAVSKNAQLVAATLRKNKIVARAMRGGKTKVVAARYDLDTGQVSLL